jgi:apolipoprotein D and lipocalin family protein
MKKLITAVAFIFSGCLGMPEAVIPVKEFEIEKYLGKWYEIARLDHSFERGLECVTAEYSLREDGGVKVVNRGVSVEKNQWREAQGKAFFVNESNEGYLKVSFFGPFYGVYVVFELDRDNYRYAFVTGPNKSYLWLLSRTPTVESGLLTQFIGKAKELGYETDKLIYVNQTGHCNH